MKRRHDSPNSSARKSAAGLASRPSLQEAPSSHKTAPTSHAVSVGQHSKQAESLLSPQDLLALYRPDLSQLLAQEKAPPFRSAQVVEHLFLRPARPFAEATALPSDLRIALDNLGASSLVVQDRQDSADGTTKLLLQTAKGPCIETVIMRYPKRVTACLSSQAGCPVGCVFCATGTLGLIRNLTAAEIVDQARLVSALVAGEGRRLSNLVYMGMGEPLLNLQAVLDSIRILTNPRAMNLGHRAISVSTVGIPAGMKRLAEQEPQVNLAVSLHAADDKTRALLIPSRFRHPLADVLTAAWDHFRSTKRKLFVEYVLLGGVNDSADQARRLATLLRGHVVTVNLLAWNPVQIPPGAALQPPRDRTQGEDQRKEEDYASSRSLLAPGEKVAVFRRPSAQAVLAFRDTLLAAGIEAVVRESKGVTIRAACGQLAAKAASPHLFF